AADATRGRGDTTEQWVTGDPAMADREPVRATLRAWAVDGPAGFVRAAECWRGVMVRERVRCLLAAGESASTDRRTGDEPDGTAGTVDLLLTAEEEARRAGLVLLLGRVRRVLRQHGIVRRPAPPTAPPVRPSGGLSAREFEAMALVGQGHSTRRIAELLGLTRNTAETYIRQAMSKLGAHTRTEAAVRAAALARPTTEPEGAR
ncbi:MAG TPA: helix-turn-helix transcriptional regulator, partial [Mycobacteriales bacterium]